jgi:hypothetical protein
MSKKKTRTAELADVRRDIRHESTRSTPALMPFFQQRAAELERPEHPPEIINGEVVPDGAGSFYVRDTLRNADTIAVDASLERTDLLQRAGALENGLDAAATIEARNSLEKMLAHQMAACHGAAMRLIGATIDRPSFNQNAEQIALKKINVAARLMDVYWEGFTAIMKTRTAGGQRIRVEHVTINGGQAVIAGTVTGGPHGEGDE